MEDSVATFHTSEEAFNKIHKKTLPAFLVLAFCISFIIFKLSREELSTGYVIFVCSLLLFYFAHPILRKAFVIGLPLAVFGVLYDFFRYIPLETLSPIIIKEIHDLDLALFGVQVKTGTTVLFNQFLLNTFQNKSLDIFCGIFYFAHVPVFILFLFTIWKLKGASIAKQYTLAILIMNCFAFLTFFFLPCAAPWYVEKYGFIQPLTPLLGDSAGLVRFDQILNTSLFKESYDFNPIVFGALPSMHTGFSVLESFFAFQVSFRFGIFYLAFPLIMVFSAMYLQHHYVLDVIAGAFYAFLTWFLISKIFPKQVQILFAKLEIFFGVQRRTFEN